MVDAINNCRWYKDDGRGERLLVFVNEFNASSVGSPYLQLIHWVSVLATFLEQPSAHLQRIASYKRCPAAWVSIYRKLDSCQSYCRFCQVCANLLVD
jgi:hypothetical protein